MDKEQKVYSAAKHTLCENLRKLTVNQFKILFTALIHYWATYKFFITSQNLYNLWCELNALCYEMDESFPSPYDDYEAMKSFCHYYPYYFIEQIPLNYLATLFADHIDDHIDILTDFAKYLSESDLQTAYKYINDALGLTESVDELVSKTQMHIKFFSY